MNQSITVYYENMSHTIEVTIEDNWVSLCDKINEQIFRDTNKSHDTGHYDHGMYYLTYQSILDSNSCISYCCKEGKPIDQINFSHSVYVNFSFNNIKCCKCFIIPRDECVTRHCHKNTALVHNLYCGHELFCFQCADKFINTHINECPVCGLNKVKLVHEFGKCHKCHQFDCTHDCKFD